MHPELWRKSTNSIEESAIALGSLELKAPKYAPTNHLQPAKIALRNRFGVLADDEDDRNKSEANAWGIACVEVLSGQQSASEKEDIGSLDVVAQQIDNVEDRKPIGRVPKQRLRSAGRGKITIDSGAAESVLPPNVVPGEMLKEGDAKKAGVKYMAACGTAMANHGEKRVKFKAVDRDGNTSHLAAIQFQVTDVNKPLAAVSRILDQGNSVLFTRKGKGSCIIDDKTNERVYVQEENRVFVLDVEFYEPVEEEQEET